MNLLKSRISEIHVKRIRVNQGVGVLPKMEFVWLLSHNTVEVLKDWVYLKINFVQSIPSECAAHASDMKYGPYWPDVIHFLFSNMKRDKALFAISYAPYQSPKKEIWASNCNKSNPSISSSNSKANLSNWHIRNNFNITYQYHSPPYD